MLRFGKKEKEKEKEKEKKTNNTSRELLRSGRVLREIQAYRKCIPTLQDWKELEYEQSSMVGLAFERFYSTISFQPFPSQNKSQRERQLVPDSERWLI